MATTTTTTTPLSERIIPARRAARRASAIFAEQVHDSPGHSDEEPEPSGSFGEPTSRRQPNVKYRYNAKGKFRASPLKQSDSPSSPKRQSKPKHKRTPKPMTSSHSEPFMVSKKRKAATPLSDREGTASTLTTLSPSPFPSPRTSPVISTKKSTPLPTTPLRKLRTRSGSMRSIKVSSSKATSFSESPRQSFKKKKAGSTIPSDKVNGHFGDVDTLVWVLVNDLGAVTNTVSHDDEDIVFLEKQLWWPARIVQKEPLRVTLFGDLALSREPLTILVPSESNIKPVHDLSGQKLFSRATFQVSSPRIPESSNSSPRKKAKTGICERWEAAVKAMENADELKRDGMPEMISAYTGRTSSEDEDMDDLCAAPRSLSQLGKLHTPKSKAVLRDKGKNIVNVTTRNEIEASTDRAWSPPPPDPTLQLPGELVLAQAPRTRGNKYWPAQLISYVPPTKPDGKQRYRVKFLDDQEYNVTRDKFWTSEEENFVTCDMGEFESAVRNVEAPDSENEQDGLEDKERSPSPQLTNPPPAADDFAELPMRTQLAYVKPVLNAILQGKYTPASKNHNSFMRGGAARSSLMKRAAVRGELDPSDVKQLQKLISLWALGDEYARIASKRVEPPPEQETTHYTTTLAANGSGLAEADIARPHVISPSDRVDYEELSQLTPTSDDIGNQVDNSDAIIVDRPDWDDSSKPKMAELSPVLLQESKSCTTASITDGDVLAAGQADEVSAMPSRASDDVMSHLIPLSDIRSKVDAVGAMVVDMPVQVDDALESKTNNLPPALLRARHPAPNEVPEQSDLVGTSDLSLLGQLELHTSPLAQQHPVCSQEYEALSTLDKLDYCVNILLPEAIQQILLWRSGERTSAALLSPEEEARLHECGEAKAQETDWVYDLLRLREAQARLSRVDQKAKGKEKNKSGDAKGGTRSRPRRSTISR